MITNDTLLLQRIAAAAIAVYGTEIRWGATRDDSRLKALIAAKLIATSGNSRRFSSLSETELLQKLDLGMAGQSQVSTITPYPSGSRTELLQVIAGTIGVDGTTLPFASRDDTLLMAMCAGAVVDPVTGGITQLVNTVESVTNDEKLMLDPATPVGTQKSVTDSVYVTGFGDVRDGFYFPSLENSIIFVKDSLFVGDGGDNKIFSDASWHIGNDSLGYVDAASTGGGFPWERTYPGLTLLNPALQKLNAPNNALGGILLTNSTQDGIYSDRGLVDATYHFFGLLGTGATGDFMSGDTNEVHRVTDINNAVGIGPNAPGIVFYDSLGNASYYSASNVATPDLASNWKNASDGSPAPITVTAVSKADLVNGLTITGTGLSITSDIPDGTPLEVYGAFNGYPVFRTLGLSGAARYLVAFDDRGDGFTWRVSDAPNDSGLSLARADGGITPRPSGLTWIAADVTVSDNPVAAQANWGPV